MLHLYAQYLITNSHVTICISVTVHICMFLMVALLFILLSLSNMLNQPLSQYASLTPAILDNSLSLDHMYLCIRTYWHVGPVGNVVYLIELVKYAQGTIKPICFHAARNT